MAFDRDAILELEAALTALVASHPDAGKPSRPKPN